MFEDEVSSKFNDLKASEKSQIPPKKIFPSSGNRWNIGQRLQALGFIIE
jgi:hypothetical protein